MTGPKPDEEAIFKAARRLTPGEPRDGYLAEACGGDEALLRRVQDLLQVDEQERSFLAAPAIGEAFTTDLPSQECPGTVLGPYKLLEEIGEGGFGVVFLAEQTEPVRRKVALKILKPGMDSRQVVARFEAERQALAIMDHPNVAKVFDGGATASGRPYFVMELVRGVPVTEYCDQNHLSPRQRLELFTTVCQAVQHAHQKGIVHRDLKPSNILVSRHDTTPVVKVIDFGIAKALGQELTEKTLFTGIAQMIGTPQYMSPEQAGMSDLDIDTRSDIYSLGVLLYELLTGTTPFTKERFRKAAFDEIRRIIREEEPPKPSTRLSDSKDSLPSISAQRQTEPAKLTRLMRGDLDWIVMKCLEKDRNRRYATANGLASDIQRYLADDPVEACPPSAAYRFRKFVRRNKGPVTAASTIALCLAAGIVGTTTGLVWAVRERDQKARALAAETSARLAEQQARDKAIAALRTLTDEVVENQLARSTTLTDENKEFLRKIITQYEGFASITADDAENRAIRAEYGNLGTLFKKTKGRLKEAEQAYAAALALFKQVAAEDPTRPECRQDLALSYQNMGEFLRDTNRLKEAADAQAAGIAVQKQLVSEYPNRPEFREKLAVGYNNIGRLLWITGPLNEAESAFAAALTLQKQLAADFPTRPEYRVDLAHSQNNLGVLYCKTYRFPDAEAALRAALELRRQLVADFRDRTDFRRHLAGSYANLGVVLEDTNRLKEAEEAYVAALAIARQLAAIDPNQLDMRNDLASALGNLAFLHLRTRDFQAAKARLDEALPHHEAVLNANAGNPIYRQFYQNNLGARVQAIAGQGDPAAAKQVALKLRDLAWDPPANAYDAACALSLCIPIVEKNEKASRQERDKQAKLYGDEAMTMLREAVSKGFKDAAHMKQDKDLVPLRGREDFNKLLEELEANKQ